MGPTLTTTRKKTAPAELSLREPLKRLGLAHYDCSELV